MKDKHVGTFGDYALFSFGVFKFTSTYFGGAMFVRDPADREALKAEIDAWPKMSAGDMLPHVRKGLKFSVLTHLLVFNVLTFPLWPC